MGTKNFVTLTWCSLDYTQWLIMSSLIFSKKLFNNSALNVSIGSVESLFEPHTPLLSVAYSTNISTNYKSHLHNTEHNFLSWVYGSTRFRIFC